ncbi:MAG: endonuclease Q family protein [candidate division WOR-3 bacterium]
MKFIADLHIHSRFSRATSRDMDIPAIARAAKKKGIKLVATGDFTHPAYMQSLKQHLEPATEGLYCHGDTYFIVNVEVNNIYSAHGRLRRIHNIIFVPSLETAARVSTMLSRYGKLESDGRPTLSISSQEMLARVLDIDEQAFLVPAHIWTPWFSLYGSNSGFDSFEECFGELSNRVFAVETGLSSDPPMNWLLSSLDTKTIISNSDAHSPSRLGREANVFDCELAYPELRNVLRTKDRDRFLFTIEFFPEEGKYHYDGHRSCNVCLAPEQSMSNSDICPVCGRKLTVGVLHRVMSLADRRPEEVPGDVVPYKHLVPLEEMIAEALGQGRDTAAVGNTYDEMIAVLGPEFEILLDVPIDAIRQAAGERIALGIERMRKGEVMKQPGYDGVFGVISVIPGSTRPSEDEPGASAAPGDQLDLF